MKYLMTTLTMLAFLTFSVQAQQEVKSPPKVVKSKIGNVDVTIDYSSPAVKGRTTWGGQLVPFEKVWRTGANSATWIESSGDLSVAGETLPAGKYSIFTIPHENNTCTVIFNKEWKQWGHYNYNEAEDVLRITVPKTDSPEMTERMTFDISDSALMLKWHDWIVSIDTNAI